MIRNVHINISFDYEFLNLIIMCIGILLACMYVHHMQAWC